ncbi:ArnT family glycosyltransferase [Ruegeria sp.]|uniref:ArnT family glycosyltransferase n=1 Tax=Ruegeria sp. TaxID=1879320 RepID=UPI003C7BB76F
MQTFFVHGFTWLGALPGHEMEQIFAARLVMIGCLGLTTFSIHRIARHFTTRRSADIAVLGYLTSGFVLAHGASFRADPIAAALLTTSIMILLSTRLSFWQMVAAAIMSALAVLVTIKSALYLPAFLAVLIWRIEDRSAVLRIIVAGVLAGIICASLYLWHASGIRIAEGNETAHNAKDALNTTLLKSGMFPRATELLSWAMFSIPQIILVGLGVSARGSSRQVLLLMLFAAPLFAVVIYRNAFVYFFPFAVPLLMVGVAIGAQRLDTSRRLTQLVVVMFAGFCIQVVQTLPDRAATQHATIAEVHRLFPEPVSYIDDSHMIASFPNPGFFMSGWGVARYRAEGHPVFAGIIAEHQPPMLIANKTALAHTMDPALPDGTAPVLLPEDHAILRKSYVHYLGSIWLAGREVALTGVPVQLVLPFPGNYRVEADQPVQIDTSMVETGDVLAVRTDPVKIIGPEGVTVRLIWDTGVAPSAPGSLDRNIYVGFRMLSL